MTTRDDVESEWWWMNGDGACVVAFYKERLLLSKRTLSIKGVSVWVRERECVCVSGGGGNSVHGGEMVLLRHHTAGNCLLFSKKAFLYFFWTFITCKRAFSGLLGLKK
jgi:hypothetical protein